MKRGQFQERSPWAPVARTLLVVVLALVVLWQLGHSFVPRNGGDAEQPARQAFITTSDVNLRSGPGTSHDVLSVLPVKTGVSVTGAAQQGFVPVTIGGQQAWIAADYLAPEGSVLAATVNIPDEAVAPAPTAIPTAIPTAVPTEAPAPEVQAAEVDLPVESTIPTMVEVEENVPEPLVYTQRTVEITEPEPGGERWIEIDRTGSTVVLHEGDHILGVYDGLMGKDPAPDGFYSTAVGTHYVFSMERELTETPFAPGVYLTDWVGFDPERSNGIHSPVRDAEGNVVVTGGTVTLGCVRLSEDAARTVFDFAYIGMRVEVHD